MTTGYEVMSRKCDQCLTGKNRVVSGQRAAQLIRECRDRDVKFECHKASLAGRSGVACRGVHAVAPCRASRFADRFGIPTIEIDPETMEPVDDLPHRP